MSAKHLVSGAIFLTALGAIAIASAQSQPPTGNPNPAQVTHLSAAQQKVFDSPEQGERVFKQNCSRCHTAPEGFSPRIAGTIIRHMRVRASLSQQDERALMRYLNP